MKRGWEEVITSTNMTDTNRKAWKLSKDPTTSSPPCLVSANQFPHQLLAMAEVTCDPHQNDMYSAPATEGDTFMVYLFSEEEYRKVVALLKTTKPLEKIMLLWSNLRISFPKPIGGCG